MKKKRNDSSWSVKYKKGRQNVIAGLKVYDFVWNHACAKFLTSFFISFGK